MARINKQGNIIARCMGCDGALSSFVYLSHEGREIGVVIKSQHTGGLSSDTTDFQFRLFKCSACGFGALGCIRMHSNNSYPDNISRIEWFKPEGKERLKLPPAVPQGIVKEFREAETCMEANAIRAASGMFRSVLDKTMRANGYKIKLPTKNPKRSRTLNLYEQIELAAEDGVITRARKIKAHEEIRVLGNDVLHDEWREVDIDDVEASRHYAQRILEDLYDDRETVLKTLKESDRIPDEVKKATDKENMKKAKEV